MSFESAVLCLRLDPEYADLIRDSYLGPNVLACAARFSASAEFHEVRRILGGRLAGATVLDLGAGNGIASYAFWRWGASRVLAVEPDGSPEVGRAAIATLASGRPIEVVDAVGERLPLKQKAVDLVYVRQALHHASDLRVMVNECARVLKPGGTFMACREHVVSNQRQLNRFLASHPVHQLTGRENAFPLSSYLDAIRESDMTLTQVLGPWDTVINAFPAARSRRELAEYSRNALKRRLRRMGPALERAPGVNRLISAYLKRPVPGRMYSFVAVKS